MCVRASRFQLDLTALTHRGSAFTSFNNGVSIITTESP